MNYKLAIITGLVVSMLAVSAACSSGSSGAKEESGVIAGVAYLDAAGLHDIDESINTNKTVPATARTVALKSAAVVRNTEWPSANKTAARNLADTMVALAEELDKENVDMAKAGELAHKMHEEAHDFTDAVWNELYGKVNLPVKPHEHDD